MPRRDMQDVELADGPPGSAPTDPAGAGRPRGVRRRRVVAGVAVVAVALGAWQWGLNTRDAAAVARLSRVPGVVAPVDGDLEVVQRFSSGDPRTVGRAGGELVRGQDGSQTYRWRAVEGPGWSVPLLGPDIDLAGPENTFGGSSCVTDAGLVDDDSAATRVTCLVTDGASRVIGETGEIIQIPATSTDVVVLDPADGSVLAQWPCPGGESVAVLPGLLVVGTPTAVSGRDPLTGAERWTFELPGQGHETDSGTWDVSVSRAGDLIAVTTATGALQLLSADGASVRAPFGEDASAWGWWVDTSTGRPILINERTDGTARATLLAADGDPGGDRPLDGRPVSIAVDDGSLPGLFLTADSAVRGWDAETGAQRWTGAEDVPGTSSSTSALVVRGRVYLAAGSVVVALDGTTGRMLWRSAPEKGRMPGSLLTDGRYLLAALDAASASAVPTLVAYDFATGAEAFRTPYPTGVERVSGLDGRLYGYDDDGGFVLLG